MKTGYADLPLHSGKCPRWLFKRMKKLVKAISEVIIYEYSQEEFLNRLSDPYFFQSLGCVVGFDWHSSGLTTTLTGAIKEVLNPEEHGILVAGGKGKASRKTPEEIGKSNLCSSKKLEILKKTSRLSAKVDSNCVQDGYSLYHHVFIFTEKGNWIVIQQGMNSKNKYARRYHWLSKNVNDFVEEPHEAICCDKKESEVLDLTSKTSKETKEISVDLLKDNPEHLKKYLLLKNQKSLLNFSNNKSLKMPRYHDVKNANINTKVLDNLKKAYEKQPEDYEELVGMRGVGAKSLRALALISQLIYGSEASWKDPATHSYAHGGKDGYPEPVNLSTYSNSIEVLKNAVEDAKLEKKEKLKALKKLCSLTK